MKKLLLYLVAIITMSTLSVDALADKYVYIQNPGDNTTVNFWWWGDSNAKAELWYDYNTQYPNTVEKDGKTFGGHPDLSIPASYAGHLTVDKVTGADNNNYYKVTVTDDTNQMIVNKGGKDITIDFTQCYSSSGATLGLVSEIIKEQGGEDPDPTVLPAVVSIKTFKSQNGNDQVWDFDSATVVDGVCVIKNVYLSGGFNFRFRYDASTEEYHSVSGENTWNVTSEPASFANFFNVVDSEKDGKYQKVNGAASGVYYDITFNFNDLTYTIVEHVEDGESVTTYEYTWAAKESAEKAFELVLVEGVYTLSNALSNVPQAFYLECTKKVYVDDVEDTAQRTTTVYGWTNHSGLEPNGEITLYKDNNPITFAEGYENFNLSFAHVEGTPDNVKINFTATKEVKVEMPQVVSIKTYKRPGDDGQVWDFDSATVVDGVCVIKNVYLSGGFNFRFRYDATTEEYHSVSGENTWNVTSEPTSFANFFNVVDSEKDGKYQKVNGASDGVYYDITFNFNDLTYTIVEHVEQVDPSKVTTVYFIDRQNWGNLHCYNYSDKGISQTNGDVDNNAGWPGQKMDDITDDPDYANLKDGIQGFANDRGYKIYKVDLTKTQADDEGNYTLPKLVFTNNSGSQTPNLYLVKDGIYTNGTTGDLADGQIAVKASDYLPRQWYKADAEEGEQCVFTYPNNEVSTSYNYIYVDIDAYTNAYKGIGQTDNKSKQISVQIEYTRDGENFVATGLSGTHYLSLVTINGKDYLRVAIANDVIPDNQVVKLIVWEGNGNEASNKKLNPDVSGNWSAEGCVECENGDCDYSTDKTMHTGCSMDSHCPLIITNAVFTNGALFTRSSEQDNILTKTMPTRMYVVDNAKNGAFDLAGLEQAELVDGQYEDAEGVYQTFEGSDYVAYDVTSTLKDGEYVIPNVPQKADFYMLGAYDTEENGVTTTVYHFFSNDNNPEMLPGNNYPFRFNEEGNYTITEAFGTAREYTIYIHWADQVVSVRTEAKPNAFQLGQNRDGNSYVGVNYQIAHFLFAVEDEVDNKVDGKYFDEIHIMHASEFDPGNYKETHSVKFNHNKEYDEFMAGKLNKAVTEDDCEGKLSNADPASGVNSTHSTVGVRAYTAGIYTLTVSNDEADGIAAASSDIPVRVIPTIESLGMNLNYLGIFDEATLNCSYAGDFVLNLGALPEAGTGFDEKDANGVTYRWDENRIGFFPTMADYIVDGKTADETLQIWWAYLDGSNVQTRVAREATVVSAYNGLTATANPFGTPEENGLKRFSYTNAMSADGIKAAKGFKVQMVQNGIASPVYIFNATDQTGTTGVDELGVEEGEAVYYDLNGVKVDGTNHAKGIYVKVVGNKATKVFVK